MKTLLNILVMMSVMFNLLSLLNYYNSPSYKIGKLKQDMNIRCLPTEPPCPTKANFTIPKGTTVVDASPQGIAKAGLFDPNRISITIIVSSDSVDYSQSDKISYTESLYEYRKEKD